MFDPSSIINYLTYFKCPTIMSPEFEKTVRFNFSFTFRVISIETSAFYIIRVSLYPEPMASTVGFPTRLLMIDTMAPFCFGDRAYPKMCLLKARMKAKCSSITECYWIILKVFPLIKRENCLFLSISLENTDNPTLFKFLFCK